MKVFALLALLGVHVADAAVRGGAKWAQANVHSILHGHEQRSVTGSKVGMHREDLLFTKERKHAHRKMGHRMVNAMEVIHKTAYWGTVKLGTPAQEFKVIFDTGSGNLILPASRCNMAGCNTHKKYAPSDSSTSKAVVNERGERSTEISFGTGDISGDYYEDKFCIAENLCTNVRFVAANAQSAEPFSVTPFDGILGLGFNDLSMGEHFNILDDLNANGQLPMGTFAVYLTDDANSEITFGGYKPDQVASDIVWAEVVRESYWQVGVDDITFNNVETGLCKGGCQVAVDTGTSMLAGPSDLVEQLSNKLAAKDDCSNFNHLPTIGFKVGSKVLNLSPEDYMDKGEGDCSFSVMSLDVPPPKGPLFIFGDPFLRRFVTIYDKNGGGNGPRVGFAVAKHGSVTPEQAATIISDVKGKQPASLAEHNAKEMKADAKLIASTPIAVSLDAGMMTRDASDSTDHSSTEHTSSNTESSESTWAEAADTEATSSAKDDSDKKESKEDRQLSDMGDDFSHAVDDWLKHSETPLKISKPKALVQTGLRGRHLQPQKLVTIKLHRSK